MVNTFIPALSLIAVSMVWACGDAEPVGLQDGGLQDGGLQDGGLQDGGLQDGGLIDTTELIGLNQALSVAQDELSGGFAHSAELEYEDLDEGESPSCSTFPPPEKSGRP